VLGGAVSYRWNIRDVMALVALSALLLGGLRTEIGRLLAVVALISLFPFTVMAVWEVLVVRRL
jgi:hypothetical protein